ncbi:MAG: hydantoinase/oxoprolinase family protein, partial [Acidimicrobiia bacterium]
MSSLRVGADIGGTFTDIVAIDEEGARFFGKTLTTPSQPELGVLRGLEQAVRRSGRPLSSVERVIHGTTLVTNAIIERRGAITALLTTEGFRDQLEIASEGRYDSYDLHLQRTEPLVPRYLRIPVRERIAADGTVIEPLDDKSMGEIATALKRHGVEAVAISFLHSYRNSVHEELARSTLHKLIPEIAICISSEVDPQIREYQRASTTVANAYTQPAVERYLRKLAEGLRHMGIKGDLLVMTSNGGVCSVDTAIRFPVRILESGPVGGVQAGIFHTQQSGEKNLVVFDMGGTTAKASLIRDGRALTTSEFEASRSEGLHRGSGLPIRAPVVDMIEIGAGGGSIATINKLRFVQVGPKSAGADPGPACYGLGGSLPTVTDADLILGYLSPTRFLGGRMKLDLGAAERAIRD